MPAFKKTTLKGRRSKICATFIVQSVFDFFGSRQKGQNMTLF